MASYRVPQNHNQRNPGLSGRGPGGFGPGCDRADSGDYAHDDEQVECQGNKCEETANLVPQQNEADNQDQTNQSSGGALLNGVATQCRTDNSFFENLNVGRQRTGVDLNNFLLKPSYINIAPLCVFLIQLAGSSIPGSDKAHAIPVKPISRGTIFCV